MEMGLRSPPSWYMQVCLLERERERGERGEREERSVVRISPPALCYALALVPRYAFILPSQRERRRDERRGPNRAYTYKGEEPILN